MSHQPRSISPRLQGQRGRGGCGVVVVVQALAAGDEASHWLLRAVFS